MQKKEIILRIPFDEADKLRYALDHVQLTGNEHIDAVLDTFNRVLKEEIKNVPDCSFPGCDDMDECPNCGAPIEEHASNTHNEFNEIVTICDACGYDFKVVLFC